MPQLRWNMQYFIPKWYTITAHTTTLTIFQTNTLNALTLDGHPAAIMYVPSPDHALVSGLKPAAQLDF
jgi:hypothetical protein